MSVPADRELLLAVLALQEGLVSREALVAALNDWADDTSRPLGDVLVARDLLGEGERAMLQMAVARRIEQDGDPVSSLAALEAGPLLGELSTRIGNAGLAAGLTSRLTDLARPPGSVGKRVGQTSAESGRFRILRSHAAGGLGEVFLAYDEELDREVAVKEIRAEYASHADLCSRFFLEAEITGGLEHPGVVPVYGLGRGADGRPFYAMQFVRGETLNEALARFHAEPKGKPDARSWNLGLRCLLGHFVAVCNTLAYAHSRGVIHRDIKPQNILLGPYGETLLVDWGLAKIVGRDEQTQTQEDETAGRREATETLRPEAAAGSTPTLFGTAVGTLAFMSPEQAAGLVDQLGPPCDIYGLGATLYMLLTGRIPFPNKELQQTRQDIIAGRCVPPRKVNVRVPPALEAICRKAMALDTAHRYRSARELGEEIEAWLADEPVRAWREPWSVRAGRWLRRHRPLVAGATAAMIVALVGLALGVLLLTAANQRTRAAKDLAETRGRESRRNFQLARSAVDKQLTSVSQDPRLQAFGLEPLRRDLLRTARDFYEQFTREHPTDPELRSDRAWACFRLADIAVQMGSKQEAAALLREALSSFEQLAREFPDRRSYRVSRAKCLLNLGLLDSENGRALDAERAFRTALEINEPLLAKDPDNVELQSDIAAIHHNLAKLHVDAQQPDRAETEYLAAIALRRALVAARPKRAEYQAELAGTQSNLGLLYRMSHRGAEAAAALKAARETQQRLVDQHGEVPAYQSALATTWNNLGLLLADQADRLAEAEQAYRTALAIGERLASEHPLVPQFRGDLARTRNNLATLYCQQGRTAEAEAEYESARKIHQRLAEEQSGVPAYQCDLASTLGNLANLYAEADEKERDQEALAAYRAALEIRTRLTRQYPDRPDFQNDLAVTHQNLGAWYSVRGKPAEAEKCFRDALGLYERLVSKFPQTTRYVLQQAATWANLGHLLCELNRSEESLQYSQAAVAALNAAGDLDRSLVPVRQVLRNALWARAEALSRLGKHAEALADWNKALEVSSDADRDRLRLGRAEALAHTGDHAQAAAEAQSLVPTAGDFGPVLYRLAVILAMASARAGEDTALPASERQQHAERHAAAAVEILQRAREAGLFRELVERQRLSENPVFIPLRSRQDFQKLLADIGGEPQN